MSKRVIIGIVCGVLIFGVLAVGLAMRRTHREPVYQGKTLREWLSLDVRAWMGGHGDYEAEQAVREMGTNAIPTLIRMLRQKDSFLVTQIFPFWDRHIGRYLPVRFRSGSWHFERASLAHLKALKGFEVLRANAKDALPALIQVIDDRISPDSQYVALLSLRALGPTARESALTCLLRASRDSDPELRGFALQILGDFHSHFDEIVPVLVKSLADTNASVRSTAAIDLRDVAYAAHSAVPALVSALKDPDAQVRACVAEALKSADYDAAVRAGVK